MIKLTTNKKLYLNFPSQDTFSDRLNFLLIHFAFFLKAYKNEETKHDLQEIYDFVFRQLELSIREIGYGDQSINKKMKDYINQFHGILSDIHFWNEKKSNEKLDILKKFVIIDGNHSNLVDYFDNYYINLKNKTLNSYLKSVSNG